MPKIQPKAVSNSSPLIYLAKVNRLDLLKNLYKQIWIPETVINETVTQGKILKITDASLIEEAVGKWILVEKIKPETDLRYAFLDGNDKIGLGEKQALKLCRQLKANVFIADDKEARRVAKLLRITTIGTCGILLQARKKGLTSNHEARQILNDLVQAKFRIETTLYRQILDELGKAETPKRATR